MPPLIAAAAAADYCRHYATCRFHTPLRDTAIRRRRCHFMLRMLFIFTFRHAAAISIIFASSFRCHYAACFRDCY